MVPAIFRGPRDLAAALSDGGFHFDEVVDRILIMEPGTLWGAEDDSDELERPGFAITVTPPHRPDEPFGVMDARLRFE